MTETFVHIWLATVEPQTSDEALEHFRELAQEAPLRVQGLKGVGVLLSDDRTRIVAISEWGARDDWGRAQWDEHVQDLVARMFRSVKRLDSHLYREVFRFGEM